MPHTNRLDISVKMKNASTTLGEVNEFLAKHAAVKDQIEKYIGSISAQVDCLRCNMDLSTGTQRLEANAVIGDLEDTKQKLLKLTNKKREKN